MPTSGHVDFCWRTMTDRRPAGPPLLITGPPAAGKTTCARRIAGSRRALCGRQLVVAGHAAPWDGAEGAAQHRLGAENACRLARSFEAYGLDVVLTDAVWSVYAEQLPGAVVVQLRISEAETRRRFDSRPPQLTDPEFLRLWQGDRDTRHPGAYELAVDRLTISEQVQALESLWGRAGPR